MNIHPNKIAAVLTKAHMIRSVSRSGSVVSYRNAGFIVTDIGEKLVVDYRKSSRPSAQTEAEWKALKTSEIKKIACLLASASYDITVEQDRVFVNGVIA